MKLLREIAMKSIFTTLAFTVLFFNSAQAHHSNRASFDTEKTITVEGAITDYNFKNPHVTIFFDVTDEKTGEVTNWMSEGAAATGLRLAGWDNDTITVGDYYRFTGDAGRNGRPMVNLQELWKVDQTTGAVIQKIEQERFVTQSGNPDDGSGDWDYPQSRPDGTVNLSGIWVQGGDNTRQPSFELNEPPVLSEVGAALQTTIRAINDPQYIYCEPANLIRQAGFTPHPVRITQYDDRVTFEYEEYAGTRTVYLDDREYSSYDESERYLMGRYKARYEGDALIIESDLIRSGWSGIFGHITSDQTTVVETYTREFHDKHGPNVKLSMIVTDPVYLAEPRELAWNKYYTIVGMTGTERDNVQLDYEMLPVECFPPKPEAIR